MDGISSDASEDSVIYISSGDEHPSGDRESDYSTDTKELVARIEKEVASSPIMIGGRVMTTGSMEEEIVAGPQSSPPVTANFNRAYFDEKLCYAPPKGNLKRRIELCKLILPVLKSPLLPPEHERGPAFADLSSQRCVSCMVCGRSVDEIKEQSGIWNDLHHSSLHFGT